MYNGTIIPSEAGPGEVPIYLMFTTTTPIGDMSKQFVTNHFVSQIKFMKTQVSEGKLTIFKLKNDKLKILVWVEHLMVFLPPQVYRAFVELEIYIEKIVNKECDKNWLQFVISH